mgnify:CR=1 FL=1
MKQEKNTSRKIKEILKGALLVGSGLSIGYLGLFLNTNYGLQYYKLPNYVFTPSEMVQAYKKDFKNREDYKIRRKSTEERLLKLIDLNNNGKFDETEIATFKEKVSKVRLEEPDDIQYERWLDHYINHTTNRLERTVMESLIELYWNKN